MHGLKAIPTSSAAAQSFDSKVDAITKATADAKKTGNAVPVQVGFTEQELTTKVAQAAASQSADSALQATDTRYQLWDQAVRELIAWPLSSIRAARVEPRDLLIFHAGAELFIQTPKGEFGFTLRRSGAGVAGHASAETFLAHLRRLRGFP